MTLDDKQVAQNLEELRDRIEFSDYDNLTAEEKLKRINRTLDSGDDPVYILDQAIEKLSESEES